MFLAGFNLAAQRAQGDIMDALRVRRTTPMMGVPLGLTPPATPPQPGGQQPPMAPGAPMPYGGAPQPQMPATGGLGGAYGTPQGGPAVGGAQRFARGGLAQVAEEDLTDQYNTPLAPTEQAVFNLWAAEHPHLADRYDYDSQGFWKAGGDIAPNGHGDDRFKKRNHPTFSDLSQYNGRDGAYGGHWNQGRDSFTVTNQNLRGRGAGGIRRYFNDVEPDLRVIIPQGAE